MYRYLLSKSDDIVFEDVKKSKNEVIENALKISTFLQEKDVKQAEVFTEDSYEFVCFLFGCLHANIPLTLLDSKLSSCGYFHLDKELFDKLLHINIKTDAKKLDESAIIYLRTSGSSGEPKSIEKTLKQLITESSYLSNFLGFKKENIVYSSASHQHFFGLIWKIMTPLIAGSKIISKPIKYPESILAQDSKNAILVTSPAILKRLNEYKNLNPLKPLYKIVTAGSALPKNVRDGIDKKIGEKITEIYGSTETGVVAYNNGDTFYLMGENKITQKDDGGIDISSSWCEFFHNNDEVEFLENGGFRLLGRTDRIVKLEDKRVSLINIEEFLLTHRYIKDCYIDKHPRYSRLLALIVLSYEGIEKFRENGKVGLVGELKKHLKERYDSVFLVRYFKILEALPTNQQGKVLKSAFKDALIPKKDVEWEEVQNDENEARFKTKTSPELFFFTNHFSNFPLLPGFVQLGFVYELSKKMGLNLTYKNSIENVKFQKFSHPNDEIEVSLKVKNDKLYFEVFTNSQKCAKGRILLG